MLYRTKLLLLTLIPILAISFATLWVLDLQSERLSARQSETLENMILASRKEELRNYLSLAENAIAPAYNSFLKTRRIAQAEAKAILRGMSASEDQYFYVYDSTGTTIVDPRLSFMQGKNWIGLENINGRPVIKELIEAAKTGQDFYTYTWQKPSTKEYLPKLTHAKYFERWDWIIGTGIYLDDIDQQIDVQRGVMQNSFNRSRTTIAFLALAALSATTLTMWVFQFTQQRMADAQLRRLNARLVDVQESLSKRLSQELHDGLSQLLVSARYGLEAVLGGSSDKKIEATTTSAMDTIDTAIKEVRRISLGLRPTVLDDIGLAAAIRGLGKEFEANMSIPTAVTTMPVGDLLSDRAKTALYRIAQEALTNIAKHAVAHSASIDLSTNRRFVRLVIEDDGKGLTQARPRARTQGLGLRNMQERIDSFGGKIKITSRIDAGVTIDVLMPISQNTQEE